MNYYNAIHLIAIALDLAGIPYTEVAMEVEHGSSGWQIKFPWCRGDIACHKYTYGSSAGHVESYHFSWDKGDVTELTTAEAIRLIICEYMATKEEE